MFDRVLMNLILFIIPMLIWSSTWYIIKFQLGVVDPLVSVFYRYALAGLIMFAYAVWRKQNLRFSLRDHGYMLLQGITLFGVNYWLVYVAEETLPSGLVAIIFSLLIFTNLFIGAAVLKTPIQPVTILAGILGVSGTIFIFAEEISTFSLTDTNFQAVILVLISVILASTGNVLSGYNQKHRIGVISGNAYGMLYGALSLLILALVLDKPFIISTEPSYIFSLIYLTIFGSIIAFGAYLTLLGKIGPHKAGYIVLLIPILAMGISTIFEDYEWTLNAFGGIILLLFGNYMILKAKSQNLKAKTD